MHKIIAVAPHSINARLGRKRQQIILHPLKILRTIPAVNIGVHRAAPAPGAGDDDEPTLDPVAPAAAAAVLARVARDLIPPEAVYVAESGVQSAQDVAALRSIGADAVLIGETLMRAPDKAKRLAELRGNL